MKIKNSRRRGRICHSGYHVNHLYRTHSLSGQWKASEPEEEVVEERKSSMEAYIYNGALKTMAMKREEEGNTEARKTKAPVWKHRPQKKA